MSMPYLAGLRLAGRRVVVIGAGVVARRRMPMLIESGAQITLIAPEATPEIARLALRGQVDWQQRPYRTGDLAGAWYVLVATDDPACNTAVSLEAEAQRTFCVRADHATAATAWTPATAEVDGLVVGVLAGGEPQRAAQTRDLIMDLLRRIARPRRSRRLAA
jgi:uroporphyrin-III C-methyltransferase/precorrin-2 dehydrogenase/sirohydrochlorin ferrochelatase